VILEIRDLSKQYVRGNTAFYAVDHVNLRADQGEFACIVGHSGSGKSTLFHMAAGLLRPSGGSVRVNGAEVHRPGRKRTVGPVPFKIGYIMQGQNLLANFTVLDNVLMPYSLCRKKPALKRSGLELLDYVGLADAADAYPSQLSGGELRRVAIARTLLLSPDLILADEPTSDLDAENTEKVLELLRSICGGGTAIVASTHDMEVLKYATVSYRMSKGSLERISA
jgi:ABC-type lipoprotein export system ATPase subunit